MDFLKLFDADFGVNGGGVEFFMPKKLLDKADVGPIFQHVGGATVAEHMAAAFAF